MQDRFNAIEALVIANFKSSTVLSEQVKIFKEKLEAELDDYFGYELPLVAVGAAGMNSGAQRKQRIINTVIEIVDCAGELSVAETTVKKIASDTIDRLTKESPLNDGLGLDGEVEAIDINSVVISLPSKVEESFVISALIDVSITIIE